MTKDDDIKHQGNENTDELNDICDECKKIDESVTQNLILTGFKICFVEIIKPAKIQN